MTHDKIAWAVRLLAGASALLWAALGLGWYTGSRWAVVLWPWPEVPMSFVLLASMAAFIAVVWATVAWSGELAALSGAGLNIVVAGVGLGAHLGLQRLIGPALVMWGGAVVGAWLLAWARRQPIRDARLTPTAVRFGFVAFTLALGFAGGALVLQQQVFPWQLHPASLRLIGALFLGAAAYFAYAAAQARWVHAAPPLWAFLAYDGVLCVPYLRLLGGGAAAVDDYYGDAAAVNMTSLSVYLAVIGSSAALALYCLFFHPATRLLRRR